MTGAAGGSTAQSWAFALWLLTAALAIGLISVAGPLAFCLNARTTRRKRMLVWGIGIVGGLICMAGSQAGLYFYELQKDTEAKHDKEITSLREQVAESNRRGEAERILEQRRLEKSRTVRARIAQSIDSGDRIRYDLEHARDAHIVAGTLAGFDRTFDATPHAAALETWRGEVHVMLEEELPGLHLGPPFSNITSVRGIGRSGFALSRVLNCIARLQDMRDQSKRYADQVVR